ncbi:GNAT family N-acetyltransferase [Dehalococcoides mccartyi]|uniref:GNAT family N-acetyltransferase n=1 Tax=Dehalococcoides mccartyi TaxID=61435 RepID=A0AB38Z864_9CHLR|nr:GNAT family N-acetyltransferase [Dehalococcoides mccartyi]WRO06737.1 GNAT family N-acetyltransferase [Dehalococcoides mccartyi]
MELRRKGEWVGKLEADFNFPDLMVIEDIEIRNDFQSTDSFMASIMQPKEKRCYRGQGLGTVLLKLAIGTGKKKNLKRICGSIVRKDVDRTPDLIEFYERHGFKKISSYPSCLADAIAYICLDLSSI